jgi:hypothetical protein
MTQDCSEAAGWAPLKLLTVVPEFFLSAKMDELCSMNHARIELSLSDALIDFVIYPTSTRHVPWEMNPIPECSLCGP